MNNKMEFQKEYSKEELEINKLKCQMEGITDRVNLLEKFYIEWLKLEKFYNLKEGDKTNV